jgi:hypothetical protein
MNKAVFFIGLFSLILFTSCSEDECPVPEKPQPPFPNPDNVIDFDLSVTYTYFCLDNQYQSYMYNLVDNCEGWVQATPDIEQIQRPDLPDPEFLNDPDSVIDNDNEVTLFYGCVDDGVSRTYVYTLEDYCSSWIEESSVENRLPYTLPEPPYPDIEPTEIEVDTVSSLPVVEYRYLCVNGNVNEEYRYRLFNFCDGWDLATPRIDSLDRPDFPEPLGFEDPDSVVDNGTEITLIFNCHESNKKEYSYSIASYCDEWELLNLVQTPVTLDPVPDPPSDFPAPDDIRNFTSGEFISVDYTWRCLNGKYINYDWTRFDNCSEWELTISESDGIGCD